MTPRQFAWCKLKRSKPAILSLFVIIFYLLFHFYFGFTLSKPFPFFLSKLAQKEPKMPLLRGVAG